MIAKRAAAICVALERDEKANPCKRQRLWSTEDYDATRSLGVGTFGDVTEARHRATGEPVAVKSLLRAPGEATAKTRDAANDALLREAWFLAACRGHPGLVALRALAVNPNTGEVALVMERGGANLHEVLHGRPFPEPEARRVMRQLLDAARHVHARGVMHRDVKLGNILVDGGNAVRICDFGLAAWVADAPPRGRAGTRRYMAPEVLLGKPDYDGAVDMWSLGCVMAELLTGAPLFGGATDDEAQVIEIFKVLGAPGPRTWPEFRSLPLAAAVAPTPLARHRNRLRAHFFPRVRLSEDGFTLLKGLLCYNTNKRLSATAALRSRWFAIDVDSSLPIAAAATETNIVS